MTPDIGLLLLGGGLLLVCLLAVTGIVAVSKRGAIGYWLLGLGIVALLVTPLLLVPFYFVAASHDRPSTVVRQAATVQQSTVEPTATEREMVAAAVETPSESLVYPENRPPWVVHPQAADSGSSRFTVSSDPYVTRHEALDDLEHQLASAFGQYAIEHTGDREAGGVIAAHSRELMQLAQLDTSSLAAPLHSTEKAVLQENLYLEQVTFPQPVSEMYQAHARVVIDEPVVEYIETRWRAAQARERLVQVGSTVGLIILGLLILSALLRIGPRVVGNSSRRLQSAA